MKIYINLTHYLDLISTPLPSPAGPPDPVSGCVSFNVSHDAIEVQCQPGFDGGLPQTFTLTLRDPHTNALLINLSNTVSDPLHTTPTPLSL